LIVLVFSLCGRELGITTVAGFTFLAAGFLGVLGLAAGLLLVAFLFFDVVGRVVAGGIGGADAWIVGSITG
jgi:hypothetical protein